MNPAIQAKIAELVALLRSETSHHCVSFRLFVNCQEHQVEFTHRTPEDLKSDGISMRNLHGDFIK